MHIHGNQMGLTAMNPYTAAAEQAAAVAKRAANVRKKLRKGAAELDSLTSPEEAALVGKWMGSRPRNLQEDGYYPAAETGSDSGGK